jgi:hypothetical protein
MKFTANAMGAWDRRVLLTALAVIVAVTTARRA